MPKMLLILSICLFSSNIYSQSGNDSNILEKRGSVKIFLFIDNDQYYEDNLKDIPYIFEKSVLRLYPNEKVFLECEIDNDKLINLKVVKEIKKPKNTITISFDQIHDKKIHKYMALKVVNPFDRDLKYSAIVYPLSIKKYVQTNILPVPAKLTSYESWPDLIPTIILKDFILLKAPNK